MENIVTMMGVPICITILFNDVRECGCIFTLMFFANIMLDFMIVNVLPLPPQSTIMQLSGRFFRKLIFESYTHILLKVSNALEKRLGL